MPSNTYEFVTRWRVRATVQEVSDILADAEDLVRWWPSVYLAVRELEPGGARGIGKVVGVDAKGWLPFTLHWTFRVVEIRNPDGLSLAASGDLEGTGVWTLEQDGEWVDAVYEWRVKGNKPLLRYLSFMVKPLFSANHHWAMAMGEESLKLELLRRRAKTPEERVLLPYPPPPTPKGLRWYAWVLQHLFIGRKKSGLR